MSLFILIGILIHLETMEGKDRMKKKKYCDRHSSIVANTMRLGERSAYSGVFEAERKQSKAEGRKEMFHADSWFASATVAEEFALMGHEFIGPVSANHFTLCCFIFYTHMPTCPLLTQVKTNHRLIPKEEVEEKMQDWPGGSHLVMKTVSPRGVILYIIGYKYNKKTTTIFIFTENAGTTEPGDPYVVKYMDEKGARQTRHVSRPHIISAYFDIANKVDIHNQYRQGDLSLEEYWETKDPYFRILTTFIGFTVTDAFLAFKYHLKDTSLTIGQFSSWLSHQLIHNNFSSDSDVASIVRVDPSEQNNFFNRVCGISSLCGGFASMSFNAER